MTGLVVEPGRLTVVVAADPEEASALAARLGRYVDSPGAGVALAGTALGRSARSTWCADGCWWSTGNRNCVAGTLAEAVDVPGFRSGDTVGAAAHGGRGPRRRRGRRHRRRPGRRAAAPRLPERGRTLSGGQRQRIVLAAALRADPEVLVLDEPTSAVDAHTEADIAVRLRRVRAGRTTVVFSTSPFLLEHADIVVFLDGQVRAVGRHRDLLRSEPRYRRLVTRGEP